MVKRRWIKSIDYWMGRINFWSLCVQLFMGTFNDRIQIPFITKKIGHRRGWIVLMQIIILISLILWSTINPTENLAIIITIGLVIAIASATQDITVDALRIEQIGENEGKSMAAGAQWLLLDGGRDIS